MTVQEICAFDSILQLVINGIAAHATYRSAIQSSEGIFKLVRSILENGKILLIHYDELPSCKICHYFLTQLTIIHVVLKD